MQIEVLLGVAVILGMLKAIMWVFEIFRFLAQHFKPQTILLKNKYPTKDSTKRPWALITGSSDGIGAEYAR